MYGKYSRCFSPALVETSYTGPQSDTFQIMMYCVDIIFELLYGGISSTMVGKQEKLSPVPADEHF